MTIASLEVVSTHLPGTMFFDSQIDLSFPENRTTGVGQPQHELLKSYKLVVAGDDGVGKSTLSTRFTYGYFDRKAFYPYWRQCVIDNEGANLNISVVDSNERAADDHYSSGDGFLLVYAVDDRASFELIRSLYLRISIRKLGKHFPIVLVGSKCDRNYEVRKVSMDEGYNLAKELGCSFIETSAKENTNVDEAYYHLVREIRKQQRMSLSNKEPSDSGADPAGDKEQVSRCNSCVVC